MTSAKNAKKVVNVTKVKTKADTIPVPKKKVAPKVKNVPVFTFREDFLFGFACSSLSKKETIARVRAHIAGTKAGWVLADKDSLPKGVEENPYPCSDHPETHKHYIFAC